MIDVQVEYDDSKARNMLRILGERAPDMCAKVLETSAEWAIALAQDKYLNATPGDTTHLHSRSGRLSSSVRWWHDGKLAVLVGTGVKYAAIHEYGGTIRAKSKPYLWFKGSMGWARVKQVTIPKRPYLGPSVTALWQTGTAERLAERALDEHAREAERMA